MVIENLGAWTARTRLPHGPKIGFLAEPRAASRTNPDFLGPDAFRFLVLREDRHPQTVLWNTQRTGHEIPGEVNRFALEIVAKAEIAEHFEKSMMSGRVADILQIIVFAAGTHAALCARCARIIARFLAEKYVLELHHARIRK